jgi:histidinol-phosphate/aromatic aminotransferase/cobyric acid decarboxylase-like protein
MMAAVGGVTNSLLQTAGARSHDRTFCWNIDNLELSMNLGEERNHPFFEPDEYTFINNRYFAEMRKNGSVDSDPSGWIETLSASTKMNWPPLRSLSRSRYYLDEGNALGEVRGQLHGLLQIWEGATFEPDCFTACPSVGMASMLTLAVLRRKGVRRIVFETPCYFAAILQAEWLGFEVVLIPTFCRDGYMRPIHYEKPTRRKPSVWWLTNPRTALGFNQDIDALQNLVKRLGSGDYLVIDEALDQTFPSQMGQIYHTELGCNIIRFKGFGKPLGLNGYRLAFILHPAEFRADMVDCLETFAGAIDVHSLEAACAIAEQPQHFRAMMCVANQQVVGLRIAAEKLALNSRVTINPLVNGYLGSAIIDLGTLGSDQLIRRHRFLLECKRRRMPVIIGPSMHFASDPPSEAVRLNFFGKREHILRCVAALTEIADGSFEKAEHDAADSSDAFGAD